MLTFIFRFFFKVLTPEEKRFILLVERGDTASVAKTILAFRDKVQQHPASNDSYYTKDVCVSLLLQPQLFDLNCTDPLGRSGLSIAIINENPEMMELLLSEGIQVRKKRKRRI